MSVVAVSRMPMRTRFIALVAGTLVLSIGWFMLAYRPSTARLTEVKAEVETTRAEVAALETRLAHLQELKRNEEQLRSDEERFAAAMPTEPAVSDFILNVQDAADEADIGFLTIAPSVPVAAAPAAPPPGGTAPPAAPAEGLQTITVSLTASGGFFAIEDFVSRMEQLDRAVSIKSFQLGGSEGTLNLSMSLQMFARTAAPAATPAPAPASPAPDATTEG